MPYPDDVEASGYADRAEAAWEYATEEEQQLLVSGSGKKPWDRTYDEDEALAKAELRKQEQEAKGGGTGEALAD